MTVAKTMALAALVLVSTPSYAQKVQDRLPSPDIVARDPRLPPKEFDKPFVGKGALIVIRVTWEQLPLFCSVAPKGRSTLGCTVRKDDDCLVYILRPSSLEAYQRYYPDYTYDLIFRHERGHCNGAQHDENGVWRK